MTTLNQGKAEKSPCPICNTVPNRETGRCRCPRPSDSRIPTANLSSDTLVTQAESLFENYLAARLVRARRTLTAAKVALLRDPRNRARLDTLRIAELETEKLHSQLLEQARRTTKIREHASTSRWSSEPETSVASADATESFRAKQAATVEALYHSKAPERLRRLRPDDRDCPSCGERVADDASVCACGYAFAPTGRDKIAEPFLTEEEVAALHGRQSKHRE